MHDLSIAKPLLLDFQDAEVTERFIRKVLSYYEYEFIGAENLVNLISGEFMEYYCEDPSEHGWDLTSIMDDIYDDLYDDVLKVCAHYLLVTMEIDYFENKNKFIQAPWIQVW